MLAVVVALLLMSLQLAAAQTNATPAPTAAVTVTPVIAGQKIAVRSTDTLAQLALSFNKPVACLQRANNLDPTNFSLADMTTILIPKDCNALSASFSAVTPTPETAESLTTATFTPIASPTVIQPTPTPIPSPTATFAPTPVPDQTYTVVYGDRLSKIADKFGLTVACLAIANSIANPDLIYVGQQLRISPTCTGGSGGGGTVSNIPPSTGINPRACQFDRNPGRVAPADKYTVQAGDSLDFIACDFGIQLKCLKDSNPQLESSLLMPGDTLNINFSCPIWQDSTLPGSP